MAHAIIFVDLLSSSSHDDIFLPNYSYPAGAYKIASVLREMNLTVLVVPNCANLTFKGVKHIVENNKDNLLWVGLSTTFFRIDTNIDIHTSYRKEWVESNSMILDASQLLCQPTAEPNYQLIWKEQELGRLSFWLEKTFSVPLIVGGVNADFVGSFKVRHKNLIWVQGYSESWIKDFTTERLANPKTLGSVKLNNTHYDNHEFKTSKIIWEPEDLIDSNDWLPLEVARGCAFNCAYCTFDKKNSFDLYKRPAVLRQELIENFEKFGITKYVLIDDLYNDSKDKVRILYDQVWSKLPFEPEWVAYLRLDMIWSDPESAAILRDSGCRYANFGIETLHDLAGKRVGKGLGKKRILETLEFLKTEWKQQTLVGAFFIAGMPFEPIESIEQTLQWSLETDLLHSPKWEVMWFPPPSTNLNFSPIQSDYAKYGVSWTGPRSWVNSEGVTPEMCRNLVKGYANHLPWNMSFNLFKYAAFRMLGFGHQDLADWCKPFQARPNFEEIKQKLSTQITARLGKMLQN